MEEIVAPILVVIAWILPFALAIWLAVTLAGMRRALEAIAGHLGRIEGKLPDRGDPRG